MLSQIGQDCQSNRPGGERRKASLILLGKSRLLQRYDPTRRLLPRLYTFSYVPSPTFFSFLYRSAATLEGDTEVEVREGGGVRWAPSISTEFLRGYHGMVGVRSIWIRR
jgi:hypothetical protein